MHLFEKQDNQGYKRRSKHPKQMRRFKHKVERQRARLNPECVPAYKVNRGWVL